MVITVGIIFLSLTSSNVFLSDLYSLKQFCRLEGESGVIESHIKGKVRMEIKLNLLAL